VSTVCSSSLVAMHHAVRGLQAGDCDLAVAGGVNLLLDGGGMVVLAQIGALSPDGTCKTFSADADGYGRGEGCALVVLKRLADAERDGDRVLGVIRGSAVNHDGRSSGLTAPSGPAQQVVLREALQFAGLEARRRRLPRVPRDRDAARRPDRGPRAGEVYAVVARGVERPLLLGSAKGVVGHLEAAAAMAGVVKVLLAFRHGVVPPNPVPEVNPELPLHEFALRINTEVTAVAAPRERARRAAVSSFGLSGTNAHVILEEPPARPERQVVRGEGPYVWPVSGRHEAQVRANAAASPRSTRTRRTSARRWSPRAGSSSCAGRWWAVTTATRSRRGAEAGGAPRRPRVAGVRVRRPGLAASRGWAPSSYAWSPVFRAGVRRGGGGAAGRGAGTCGRRCGRTPTAGGPDGVDPAGAVRVQVAQAALWRAWAWAVGWWWATRSVSSRPPWSPGCGRSRTPRGWSRARSADGRAAAGGAMVAVGAPEGEVSRRWSRARSSRR
jgi:hypothetical protein